MDIENLGESVIKQLVDKQLVVKISDLYELQEEQLLTLDGFAGKSAENLVDALQVSKKQDFWAITLRAWHKTCRVCRCKRFSEALPHPGQSSHSILGRPYCNRWHRGNNGRKYHPFFLISF